MPTRLRGQSGRWRLLVVLALMAATLAACAAPSVVRQTTPGASTDGTETAPDIGCGDCSVYTPQDMRAAYGVTSLYDSGKRGQGQTVVLIESYGSPTLKQDLDVFDQQFNLPTPKLTILNPLGTVPFDGGNSEMQGWQAETSLDVEIVHAIAPDASIVVLTSPVDETEGVQGLPQFLQLEQYAVNHHLGNVVSQSWAASEVSLNDSPGQAELAQWETFYQQATTQGGVTFFGSSGDNGASDYVSFVNGNPGPLSTTATTSFPDDSPWVTAVGGTTLTRDGSSFSEVVWNSGDGASGGGVSRFFAMPSFQQGLPQSDQQILNGKRGVPDVAAAADPRTGLAIYYGGHWTLAGGTSAASPLWAGVMAIADQVAGKPLGYINPALYKIGASSAYSGAFRDVTDGNNSVSGQVDVQGYQATTGWDPVTGLGTPNAANLIPLLIQNSQG
ncbi:MAG TPA: S53 family peptidase [Ktedonobacterales bacterium]|nr:S53 family peptidase [Ktedonobacterales bacterium]